MRQVLTSPIPDDIKLIANIPESDKGLLYEYVFVTDNHNVKGKWETWTSTIKKQVIPDDARPADLLIPTIDTTRYSYLMKLLAANEKQICVVGPTGTGKSVYVKNLLLKEMDVERFIPLFVNFSAQTTASQTQDIIMSKLDKRRKGVYGYSIFGLF